MKIMLAMALCALAVTAQAQVRETNTVKRTPSSAPPVTQVIVKWRDAASVTQQSKAGRIQKLGTRAGKALNRKATIAPAMDVIALPHAHTPGEVEALIASLESDPDVEYAVADQRRYAHAVPADPLFTKQWYFMSQEISATRTDRAWDVNTGSSATVVAVLDTGVRFEHPDLGRVGTGGKLLPGYDFILSAAHANDGDGRDSDASDPGDWITPDDRQLAEFADCEETDSSWHGTRVASLIAAVTNNGIGMAGTGWNTLILPVRVLGKCGGLDSDIIAAMRWAGGLTVPEVPFVNATPAKIINMSLGGVGACSPAYESALSELHARHVLVVASAGNDGAGIGSPANCNGVLAVTALRHAGTKVGFSNLGREADIGAPGGNCGSPTGPCQFSILAATNAGATSPGVSSWTDDLNPNLGTSFSAPLVAGAAALVHSANNRLSSVQMMTLLKETTTPFPTSSTTSTTTCRAPNGPEDVQQEECICTTQTCGAGMLNTHAAVLAATLPYAVIQAPASITPATAVTIDGRGSFAPSGRTLVGYRWEVVNVSGAIPTFVDATAATTSMQVSGASMFTLRLTITDDQNVQDSADFMMSTPTAPSPAAPTTALPKSGGGGGGSTSVVLLALCALMSSLARRRSYGA